jgi:hypothetical protein
VSKETQAPRHRNLPRQKSARYSAASRIPFSYRIRTRSTTAAPAPASAAIQPIAKEKATSASSSPPCAGHRLPPAHLEADHPHFYLHVEVDAAHDPPQTGQATRRERITNKYSVKRFHPESSDQRGRNGSTINAHRPPETMLAEFKHVGLSVAIAVEDGVTQSSLRRKANPARHFPRREDCYRACQEQEAQAKPSTAEQLGLQPRRRFFRCNRQSASGSHPLGAAVQKPVVVNGELAVGLPHEYRPLTRPPRGVKQRSVPLTSPEVKRLIESPAFDAPLKARDCYGRADGRSPYPFAQPVKAQRSSSS